MGSTARVLLVLALVLILVLVLVVLLLLLARTDAGGGGKIGNLLVNQPLASFQAPQVDGIAVDALQFCVPLELGGDLIPQPARIRQVVAQSDGADEALEIALVVPGRQSYELKGAVAATGAASQCAQARVPMGFWRIRSRVLVESCPELAHRLAVLQSRSSLIKCPHPPPPPIHQHV